MLISMENNCEKSKQIYKLKKNEINIRDPFILPYDGRYYLYGTRVGDPTGFDVFVSEDLENFTVPKTVFEANNYFWGTTDFWAPEVHFYNGKFYMFATFKGDGYSRGCAILVSDKPDEVFEEHSNGAVTPQNWECLDGTLYVDRDGTPYMVFCHEWQQIGDGTVCAVKLSKDLKGADGDVFELWKASDASWMENLSWGPHKVNFVTDGPYLLSEKGQLISLWSSFNSNGYVVAIARSNNGSIKGQWSIDDSLVLDKDGGHGMIFETFEGQCKFAFHYPNENKQEKPCFKDIEKEDLFKNNVFNNE